MRNAPAMHGGDHQRGAADPLIRPRTLLAVIDGIGSPIVTGVAGDATVHYACTVVSWRLLADQTGDIDVSVWRTDYAGFPPTSGDTILTATLTGGDKAEDDVLVELQAGDTLRFNVDSAADVTRVTLGLFFEV